MLNIRLKRIGRKKKPFYNIIVSDKLSYIQGKHIEKLGFFDPLTKDKRINIERVNYWINNGAMLSKRFKQLLKNS